MRSLVPTTIVVVSCAFTLWSATACAVGATEVRIHRLTSDCAHGSTEPAWSPDGARVAYTSWALLNDDIFYNLLVASVAIFRVADGAHEDFQGLWALPGGERYDVAPSWSPDGNAIAFATGEGSIVVGAVSEPEALTIASGRDPSWSPDATHIAFAGNPPGIWVVAADGGTPTQLTTGFDAQPEWSPDSEWIAFRSGPLDASDIYRVPAAGGIPVRVTDHPARDASPTWSRDGAWIAFESDRAGSADIWAVHLESGRLARVTSDPAHDEAPSWSPDGASIAFASDRSGCVNIFYATDLGFLSVQATTWSRVKSAYR